MRSLQREFHEVLIDPYTVSLSKHNRGLRTVFKRSGLNHRNQDHWKYLLSVVAAALYPSTSIVETRKKERKKNGVSSQTEHSFWRWLKFILRQETQSFASALILKDCRLNNVTATTVHRTPKLSKINSPNFGMRQKYTSEKRMSLGSESTRGNCEALWKKLKPNAANSEASVKNANHKNLRSELTLQNSIC
jgi:hypothetical protein